MHFKTANNQTRKYHISIFKKIPSTDDYKMYFYL